MPNGGIAHCGMCENFDEARSHCTIRNVPIESSHWTFCRNQGRPNSEVDGPLFSVVCQVRDGGGAYGTIPYFHANRAETVQPESGGDTVVRFLDQTGNVVEVASVDDYLEYCRSNGQHW